MEPVHNSTEYYCRPQRFIPDANDLLKFYKCRDPNILLHANVYIYPNPYAYTLSDPDGNLVHPDRHRHPYRHADNHGNPADRDLDGPAHQHAHSDVYPNTIANADSNPDQNPNTDQYDVAYAYDYPDAHLD